MSHKIQTSLYSCRKARCARIRYVSVHRQVVRPLVNRTRYGVSTETVRVCKMKSTYMQTADTAVKQRIFILSFLKCVKAIPGSISTAIIDDKPSQSLVAIEEECIEFAAVGEERSSSTFVRTRTIYKGIASLECRNHAFYACMCALVPSVMLHRS